MEHFEVLLCVTRVIYSSCSLQMYAFAPWCGCLHTQPTGTHTHTQIHMDTYIHSQNTHTHTDIVTYTHMQAGNMRAFFMKLPKSFSFVFLQERLSAWLTTLTYFSTPELSTKRRRICCFLSVDVFCWEKTHSHIYFEPTKACVKWHFIEIWMVLIVDDVFWNVPCSWEDGGCGRGYVTRQDRTPLQQKLDEWEPQLSKVGQMFSGFWLDRVSHHWPPPAWFQLLSLHLHCCVDHQHRACQRSSPWRITMHHSLLQDSRGLGSCCHP